MSDSDDERELFEEALASMSPADVYRGKFGSPTADAEAGSAEEPQDEEARAEVQRLRELREMENAFAGVERMDARKYYAPEPKVDGDLDQDELRAEFEAALAGSGAPEPAPTPPSARSSLADDAPIDVHTLNLRGFDPDEAVVKLGLFVDLASKDDRDLIRVRIGSNPTLLEAVEGWFRGPGSVYLQDLEVVEPHSDAAVFARIRHSDPS